MSEFSPQTQTNPPHNPNALQHKSSFAKWTGLAVLTLGLAIVVIDTTLLNVSLETIIKDLHTNIQSLQWVITAYALVLAAFTITGGRLGDLFGRKRMFMLGAIIFAVGSFMASISHSLPILLLGESIIEGFGAALMMPATASLVVANFTGADRAKAFGVWGAAAGASSAIGPLLGGYLTTHFSWRWGFRINIFVAALVVIGSIIFLSESRDERKPKLDWLGVLLSALGLLGVTFGIIESSSYGWWRAKEAFIAFGHTLNLGGISIVPYSLAFGFIILGLFLWWENYTEKKGRSPLVSLSLFQNRMFTTSATVVSILTLAMSGLIFALPIFLQSVKHLSAFDTGLAMLPLSATLLVVAPIAGIISKKVDPRYLIQIGLFLDIIAAMVLHYTLKTNVTIGQLIPGLTLYGLGMGLVFPPISNMTLSAVPIEQAGEASGVNNTLRQVGATLGAAIIGAAVLTSLSSSLAKGIQASPVIPDQFKTQIITSVASANSNVEFGGAGSATSELPPQIGAEITSLANEASAKASRDAYLYAAMFSALGLAVALFLPKKRPEDFAAEQHLHDESDPHQGKRILAAATLLIIAFGGGIALLAKSARTTIATSSLSQTTQDIRNLFSPDQIAQNTPTSTPIQGDISTATSTTKSIPPTPAPATDTKPRGSETANQTPVITPYVYTNQQLAIQIQLTTAWQAENIATNKVAITGSNGQNISIQAYDNFTDSLDTVYDQLTRSSSATNVVRTTFKNQPAISFSSSGSQGVAFVYRGKLYYIMANSLNTDPVSTLALQ